MKSDYNKINDYQLCQILKSITGLGDLPERLSACNMDEIFAYIVNEGSLLLPFDQDNLFIVYERFPIFSDILRPKRSLLVKQLFDRPDEIGVIVDSVLTGKDAVFFATLAETNAQLCNWIGTMNDRFTEATIRPIDDDNKLIIAPVLSFVNLRNDG